MKWWMCSSLVMAPDGPGSGGGSNGMGQPSAGRETFADLPADPSQDQGDSGGMSYIEEAFEQMQAEDLPSDVAPMRPPQRQTAPQATPQYPQPVVPGQRRPQAPAQPQATPPVQPQALPQGQPQAQPQPQPPTPAQPQAPGQDQAMSDPFKAQAEYMQQQEAAFLDALAKEVYPISDQDMDAFLSGDSTKVSQALARVHINSVSSVMRMVSQHMPIWVGNMLKVHAANRDAEDAFWKSAPYLDRTKHAAMAQASAKAYRQMNPQATREDMFRMVAAMVAAAAGITPTQTPGTQSVFQTPGGVRTPGRVVRNTGGSAFQPAGTQRVSGNPPGVIDNLWAQTTEILMGDEAGAFDGQM